MRAHLSDAIVGTSGLHGEIQDLHSQLEASEEKNIDLMTRHEELLQEHFLRLAELKISRRDAHAIHVEAVKEYRLSTDC